MSIIACPRCRDEVTLPPKISPQARVRCPLCRDEYILSEALATMPPALIVLDPGPNADVSGYAEPEYKVAGESSSSALAPADVFGATGPTGEGVSPAARQGVKPGRPRKRKEGSALGMMIQVVLGGVGAFLLVNPFCWWVIKEDTFGTAKFVAKHLPSIVPERWHPKEDSLTNANGNNSKPVNNNQNTAPPRPPRNGAGGTNTNNLENLDPTGLGDPVVTPPKPLVDPSDINIADPLNPNPKPMPMPMPEKPVDFTPPMPKPVDPNAKPPAGTHEIKNAYVQAVVKRQAFEQSTEDDAATRQAKGRDMYDAAADLGKLCTNADWTDPMNADNAESIKAFASELKPRIAMLTFLADERLNNESGKDSIAIAGVIKDVKTLGATHETTIEVARRDGTLFTLPIVTTQSLEGEGARLGDTVMVFGRIIREPKKDLPKYKGEAPLVIQSGATTILPAE